MMSTCHPCPLSLLMPIDRGLAVGVVAGFGAALMLSSYLWRRHAPRFDGNSRVLATATVTGLSRYPVKSCRGESVTETGVDELGLCGDRRFLVVTAMSPHKFRHMREIPKMTLVRPSFVDGHDFNVVRLTRGSREVVVDRREASRTITVSVWNDEMEAEDLGDEVAAWLSEQLGEQVRLVTIGAGHARKMGAKLRPPTDNTFAYGDMAPILIASEASLGDLNSRLADEVTIERFRPNIVIDGVPAWSEDAWKTIRINGIIYHVTDRCTRCIMTTVDPDTGVMGKEPFKTLMSFRKPPDVKRPLFGVHASCAKKAGAAICVGDTVEVLELWDELAPTP